jgi:hypothetical protein
MRAREGEAKEALLKHYSTGRIQKFFQLDAFSFPEDPFDLDMFTQRTAELRHSPPELGVRVFVHEDTSYEKAVYMIRELLAWIEEDGRTMFDSLGRCPDPVDCLLGKRYGIS